MNANPHEQRWRTIFGGVVGGQEKDEVVEDEDEGILRKRNSRDLGHSGCGTLLPLRHKKTNSRTFLGLSAVILGKDEAVTSQE